MALRRAVWFDLQSCGAVGDEAGLRLEIRRLGDWDIHGVAVEGRVEDGTWHLFD